MGISLLQWVGSTTNFYTSPRILFFKMLLPDPVLRYLSMSIACFFVGTAMYVSKETGKRLAVEMFFPD